MPDTAAACSLYCTTVQLYSIFISMTFSTVGKSRSLEFYNEVISQYQWLNWGGGSRGMSAPPPLILDPPHFMRRSLGYCACSNAPFDLFQLFNHRAPHTKRRNYIVAYTVRAPIKHSNKLYKRIV